MRNLTSVYIYLVTFILIFSSGAILDQKYPGYSQILFILLCLPLFISLMMNKKYIIIIFLFIPFYILATYFIYNEIIGSYIIYLVKFLCVLAFINYCIQKQIPLYKIINNVIITISIYSLFTYIIFDLTTLISYSNEVINSKPYRVFLGIHFHGQFTDWYSIRVVRNNSIFWEPGVYQIFLNFSLIYQLFFSKKLNKAILLVLIVNLITTFSTTGLIFGLLLFYLKVISVKTRNKLLNFIKYYSFPIISIVVYFISEYFFNQKLQFGTRSYDLRTNNLLIGLELFIEKPFFGWGFLNYKPYELIAGVPNNSNGLISMLFHQGIMGLVFYFVPFFTYLVTLIKQKNILLSIIFALFIFISCSVEPIMYTNFISVFICIGLATIADKKGIKKWNNTQ